MGEGLRAPAAAAGDRGLSGRGGIRTIASGLRHPVTEYAMSGTVPARYPVWTRGDLDGFFGLMVDNLVQVLLIVALCTTVAHIPERFIFSRMLPGVAVSLLVGNLFYGLQAHWVARRHGNLACTALPYGINTPSVIAYVIFIMGPVYRQNVELHGEEGAWRLAWQAGLLACLVSGLIEFLGAFCAERLRRVTPRAALLGVLAAVGITFIAADFAFRIYTRPLVGIVPLAFLLLAYFAYYLFPLALPGGLLAIVFGTLVAWGTTLLAEPLARLFGDAPDTLAFGSVPMSAAKLGDGGHRIDRHDTRIRKRAWASPRSYYRPHGDGHERRQRKSFNCRI